MSAKKDLDRVFGEAGERMEQEVSGLLGKKLVFAELVTELISKESFFERLSGKRVSFRIKVEGQIETECFLIVSLASAINIGGTLIMLPAAELSEVVERADYNEELQDSYGEIANIMAGALTSSFEDGYRKSIRYIRKTQEVIVPIKVDVESDEPCPNGTYYLVTANMILGGEEPLGEWHLLLPGEPFGLVEPPPAQVEETAAPQVDSVKQAVAEGGGVVSDQDGSKKGVESGEVSSAPPDLIKIRKRLDRLMDVCLEQLTQDLSGLLDKELSLIAHEKKLVDKEEFFDSISGKQIMARMDVRGVYSGESYVYISIKDAILLGATLIMLPDSGIKEQQDSEEFGGDTEDAYGEIANILAGVFTAVFEEQPGEWAYGFVKTGLEKVIPVKVDPDSDDLIVRQSYYLLSAKMILTGNELGLVHMLFPAAMFGVESSGEAVGQAGVEEIASENVVVPGSGEPEVDGTAGATLRGPPEDQGVLASAAKVAVVEADVLIYTDHDIEANNIAAFLADLGFKVKIFHFKDSSKNDLLGQVKCIFLVMREVSEQGFGVAIRINSLVPTVPLVAAGPAWTQTTVLKAVKYGAADIIITPVTQADVKKVIEHNLVSQPA